MDVWIVKKENNSNNLSLNLLRYVYKIRTNKILDEELIYYNDYGKPFYPDFYYNISHSRNYICIVVSSYNVGIDIEETRNVNLSLRKKIYNQSEISDEFNLIDMWTFKEAYSKYLGVGITIDFNKIIRKDVEKSLFVTNLSNDNYYCYVISEECVNNTYMLNIDDLVI